MLHLLFYLALQLGILEGSSTTQTTINPTDPSASQELSSDASLRLQTPVTGDVTVETETGIGSSGWDDKD
jgi:hypothetical protein